MLQLAVREVEAVRPPALAADPARALPGAGADLEDVATRDLAQDPGLGLGQPFGTPHEAGVAQELAVRGLVLVGVAVPVGPVRPARLGLVDGPALDPDRRVPGDFRPDDWSASTSGRLLRMDIDLEGGGPSTPLDGGWSGETFLGPGWRGSAAWCASTPGPATGAPPPTRSTPRCSGWSATCCRSPRSWRYAVPTRPRGCRRCS